MKCESKSLAELEIEINQNLHKIEQQENRGKYCVVIASLAIIASIASLVSLVI